MAVITFNGFSYLQTENVLGGLATGNGLLPSSWTMGLAQGAVSGFTKNGSAWNATNSGTNITELGTTTAAGYARGTINRDQTASGWSAGTADGTGVTTTGKSSTGVTFSFTGAPSPNAANSWCVTSGTTLNAGTPYFAGDTAATRTFANGDTEKVTPSLKAS